MNGFDFERFEELAAVLEFDNGMTRFEAETEAARRQGVMRWEAMNCEQRTKYFAVLESQSGTKPAISGQPARSAARTGKRKPTHASASVSSLTGLHGGVGTVA